MSNKTYDTLKPVALIVLPALAVLVTTFGEIWGFAYTSQISATISAIAVFLSSLLQFSSANYNKEDN